MGTLAEDARGLMAASAHVAADEVAAARKRFEIAFKSGKALVAQGRKEVFGRVRAADQAVRTKPGRTISLAFGLDAVVGFLLARRDRK
jgi:ElaB/YqjD/DUF883 family membrane-anchored ribosome-binding protein